MRASDRHLAIAILLATLSYDLVFLLQSFIRPEVVHGSDFTVFYAAGRAVIEGKADLLYHSRAFTDYQSALLPDLLPAYMVPRPWLYPPFFLLLTVPLALLPFAISVWSFVAGTLALAMAAVGRFARSRLAGLAFIGAPGVVVAGVSGQNTLLSVALFMGGMSALDRRPVLAGISLGALAYKPQLAILVPVALIAGRRWSALISAVATGVALCVLSAALFGIGPWRDYLTGAGGTAELASSSYFDAYIPLMGSVYGAVRSLSGSHGIAMVVQVMAAALATAVVWWTWRRDTPLETPLELRSSVLAAATLLAAPYFMSYDGLIVAAPITPLLMRAARDGFGRGEFVVVIISWFLPLCIRAFNYLGLPLTPVLIMILLAMLLSRRAAANIRTPSLAD